MTPAMERHMERLSTLRITYGSLSTHPRCIGRLEMANDHDALI
jgi:hypothetical protein